MQPRDGIDPRADLEAAKVKADDDELYHFDVTDLGLAVRAHLEGKSNNG